VTYVFPGILRLFVEVGRDSVSGCHSFDNTLHCGRSAVHDVPCGKDTGDGGGEASWGDQEAATLGEGLGRDGVPDVGCERLPHGFHHEIHIEVILAMRDLDRTSAA